MVERKLTQMRILVVDDAKVNRMLLTHELEKQGYLVASAEHGRQALEMLTATSFDLVLLDVEMPEMDGYETLEFMKNDVIFRHLPVIMVTSIDDIASAVRCIEMGAEDYLHKPFNPVLLQARVSASLDKKRLRDQELEYLKLLERELEIGREIQMSFLPAELPRAAGWEIAASLIAAREVAGDFYDAYTMGSDESICLVVGDVCDKGVGAALFMTLFRSLLRFTMGATNAFGERSPAAKLKYAVTLTNNYIADTHGDTGMFATIFFGLLDPKKGILTYINAGHEPPVIFGVNGKQRLLKSTGLAVGVVPDWEFKVEQVLMEAGDLFFAYTDGASEMTDSDGNFFGKERLLGLLEKNGKPASALVEDINGQVIAHIGDANQFDDITLMAVRRLKN
jgi:sigma-B regulation protein RsbU (phosphoserine phosphatase)